MSNLDLLLISQKSHCVEIFHCIYFFAFIGEYSDKLRKYRRVFNNAEQQLLVEQITYIDSRFYKLILQQMKNQQYEFADWNCIPIHLLVKIEWQG